MKKTRFLSLALTGTLCVSLLAGCGGSGDGGGAAQTPDAANTSTVQENTGSAFKLGGTGPLTGDAAIYGLAAQRGAQIAVDEIKEAGGDIQFALKYEDDVNVPETAVNAYNALKEWQISAAAMRRCIMTASHPVSIWNQRLPASVSRSPRPGRTMATT